MNTKNNKLFGFRLILFFILSPLLVHSQTKDEILEIQKKTNVAGLLSYSKKLQQEYLINQKMLRLYQKQFGWPDVRPGSNGRAILTGISKENQPVYTEPLDYEGNLTVKSNKLYTGGGLNLDLHGESMTAAVFDDGAIYVGHTALEGRAVVMDGATVTNPHPTRVAGQIIASSSYNTPFTNSAGQYIGLAMGIAFKANVHGYNSGNDLFYADTAASNGLLVSNHSYGTSAGSFYDEKAQKFDNISFMAPYYLSVWACGNSSNDAATTADHLNPHSVGKNSLAVANVLEVVNYTGPGSVTRNSPFIVSSFGPSDDGRIKPDISAPGFRQRFLTVGSSPPNEYDSGDAGTSYSAPIVTGAILLFQQHFNNLNGRFMHAATAKGLMLHTAFEAGPSPGPDISFGWGLLNTENAVNAITNDGGKSMILEDSLDNGNTFSKNLVASGNERLMATLTWTDHAGTEVFDGNTMRQLINDLDLRIVANDSIFFPWKLDSTNYISGTTLGAALKGDNIRDNVERVEIQNPVAGQVYTLKATHKGSLIDNVQAFSLVVTGLEECVATRTISSDVNYSTVDRQEASSAIIAGNKIASGSSAIYHGGNEVLLSDGFTAEGGSVFRAYNEGCTNDYASRKGVKERPVVTYNIPKAAEEELVLPDNAIYPNPGNGVFRVKLTGLSEGNVEVLNQKGVKFFDRKFKNQEEMQVNMKATSSGIYFVRVISEGKVLSKKIVKE